jgi:DNA-binding transcriptional LysR family regulator
MEFRHIQLFCLIMELQSVTKAARASGLSQPTVSQHLKNLESEIGVQLFHRRGRRIIPTPMGELFYPYAKRICEISEEAKTALSEKSGVIQGEVRLVASTIPGQYLLPKMLKAYLQAHPLVRPQVDIGDSEWALDEVKKGNAEMGFVGLATRDDTLVFDPFFTDEVILVAPPDAPWAGKGVISLDELASLPMVLREPGSGTGARFLKSLREGGIDPKSLMVVAQLGSTEAIIQAVKSGLGVGVVSCLAVEDELSRGSLVKIQVEGYPLRRTFYMTYPARGMLSPAARTLRVFVKRISTSGLVP